MIGFENNLSSTAASHKCLSCGSTLNFSIGGGELVCSFCGETYEPEIFEITDQLDIKDNEAQALSFDNSNKSEYKDKFDREIDLYWQEYLESQREIVCNSCGAKVRAGKNTMSTTCVFCGSTAIVESRVQKEYRPDGIIPFKIDENKAQEEILKWIKKKKLVPGSVKKHFEDKSVFTKMKAVYVPTWLVDADCSMAVSGQAGIRTLDMIEAYNVSRYGKFTMSNVPFDGSRKIKDKLMEAIEPYDYNGLVEFAPAYLNGMYAECYDLTPGEMANRIRNRFKDYMYDVAKGLLEAKGYNDFDLDHNNSRGENYTCRYVLLPVWTMQYTYNDVRYTVLVNGQTGEVAGDAPVSDFKVQLFKMRKDPISYLALGAAIVGVLIVVAILVFLVISMVTFGDASRIMPLIGIFVFYTIGVVALVFAKGTKKLNFAKVSHSEALEALTQELEPDKMPSAMTYITKSWGEYASATDDFAGRYELDGEKKQSSVFSIRGFNRF